MAVKFQGGRAVDAGAQSYGNRQNKMRFERSCKDAMNGCSLANGELSDLLATGGTSVNVAEAQQAMQELREASSIIARAQQRASRLLKTT